LNRRPDADREPSQRRAASFAHRVSSPLCAAKIRPSLLKALSALARCGILTAARFFDPGKNRNRPAAEFFSNGKNFSGKRISID
jgi:hypothetical protein